MLLNILKNLPIEIINKIYLLAHPILDKNLQKFIIISKKKSYNIRFNHPHSSLFWFCKNLN